MSIPAVAENGIVIRRRNRKEAGEGCRISPKRVILLAIVILLIIIILLDRALRIPLRELAFEKVRAEAAEILNQAVHKIVSERALDGTTDKFTNIENKEDGTSVLFIDAIAMGLMASEIIEEAQLLMDSIGEHGVGIPFGTISGITAFTGMGPEIKVGFYPVGSVTSTFASRFIGAGINQTRYCAYICLTANLRLILNGSRDVITVTHMAPICETIIVGEVPAAYTNVDSIDDALNLIPSGVE